MVFITLLLPENKALRIPARFANRHAARRGQSSSPAGGDHGAVGPENRQRRHAPARPSPDQQRGDPGDRRNRQRRGDEPRPEPNSGPNARRHRIETRDGLRRPGLKPARPSCSKLRHRLALGPPRASARCSASETPSDPVGRLVARRPRRPICVCALPPETSIRLGVLRVRLVGLGEVHPPGKTAGRQAACGNEGNDRDFSGHGCRSTQ